MAESLAERSAPDRARFQIPNWRAGLRIDHVLPQPISRRTLEEHPDPRSLDILRFWQATNFHVTPDQAEALGGVVSSAGNG